MAVWGDAKAIETVYRGYRFRSRLEARWAVFFDTLGVKFEYEPEGFDLGDGVWYLPDFWLPDVGLRGKADGGLWVEIKPTEPTEDESDKCGRLATATNRPVICFCGPPHPRDWQPAGDDGGYQWKWNGDEMWWDNCMLFVGCHNSACGCIKVEFNEGNYMVCPVCHGPADDESDALNDAYVAARQARFEWRRAQTDAR